MTSRALNGARTDVERYLKLADPEERSRLAHRLKGTARSFGLAALGDAAEALERAAAQVAEVEALASEFVAVLRATATALATWASGQPGGVRRVRTIELILSVTEPKL